MSAERWKRFPLDRSERIWLVLACLVALVLRLVFGRFNVPMPWGDVYTYVSSGAELLNGRVMSSDIVMPGYPLFLALVAYDRVLQTQAILSAGTVALVYLLSREVFDRVRLARAAAVFMVLSPLAIFYANQRMTETLFTALLCLVLLALYRQRYFLGSVLLVAMVLVRPTFDLLAPWLVAAFCFVERPFPGWPRVMRRVGLYGLVYVVLMTPWWIHNYEKYGQFVRLNLGDGIVMRMEHNEIFAEQGFWKQLQPVLAEFSEVSDPVERNRLQRAAAWRFIEEDPPRYLGLALQRLGRFWSPVIDQAEGFLDRWVRLLALPLECVMLGGSLLFLLRCRGHTWLRVAPLLVIVAYLTAVHVALNALVRYRVPLVPILAVFAAAGWAPWLDFALGRHRGGASGPATLGNPVVVDTRTP